MHFKVLAAKRKVKPARQSQKGSGIHTVLHSNKYFSTQKLLSIDKRERESGV